MLWFSMHEDCSEPLLCYSLVCDTLLTKLDPAKEQIWREGMVLVKKIMERTDYKVSSADGKMDNSMIFPPVPCCLSCNVM